MGELMKPILEQNLKEGKTGWKVTSQDAPGSRDLNPAAKQKLEEVSGGDRVDPSIFNITRERAKELHRQFEGRVRAETDIDNVVAGILPSEAVFDPKFSLDHIDTGEGPVRVKRLGRLGKSAKNFLYGLLIGQGFIAEYLPRSRVIKFEPKLDAFSTVVAAAKGKLQNIDGIILSHEATHAHQYPNFDQLDPTEKAKLDIDYETIRQAEPNQPFGELLQLAQLSRDVRIISEVQANMLEYSLSGGPDIPSGSGSDSIIDLIQNEVKIYLPKSDKNNEGYLNRIQTATLQILQLLDRGISHLQIAELMRRNYVPLQTGNEWDKEAGKYKFFERALEEHPK